MNESRVLNLQIVAMQRTSEYRSAAIAIVGCFSTVSNAPFSRVSSFPHSIEIKSIRFH